MIDHRNAALQYLIIVFDSHAPPPYYARLMSIQPLPLKLDLTQLAVGDYCFAGVVDPRPMDRIADRATVEGPIDVQLQVAIGKQVGTAEILVTGQIHAQATMQCERCLGNVHVRLASDFELTVVDSEEAADALPMDITPVVAERGQLSVLTLVEDELILALPIVAVHEKENCSGTDWTTSYQKPHPMAALAKLKDQQDK